MAATPGADRPFTNEHWVDLYVWDMERHFEEMRECALASGRPVLWYVYLADLGGMNSFRAPSVVPLLRMSAERVERCVFGALQPSGQALPRPGDGAKGGDPQRCAARALARARADRVLAEGIRWFVSVPSPHSAP